MEIHIVSIFHGDISKTAPFTDCTSIHTYSIFPPPIQRLLTQGDPKFSFYKPRASPWIKHQSSSEKRFQLSQTQSCTGVDKVPKAHHLVIGRNWTILNKMEEIGHFWL